MDFDTSTLKGVDQADRYKMRLENQGKRAIQQTLGLNRVRIYGAPCIGDTVKKPPKPSHS